MTTITRTSNGTGTALVDLQIEAEVNEIRALNEQIKYLQECVAAKKEKLGALLTQRGENWSDETGGYARLVADSTRASYDREALDALTLRSKWWYARLNRYRKESPVRGGVSVR